MGLSIQIMGNTRARDRSGNRTSVNEVCSRFGEWKMRIGAEYCTGSFVVFLALLFLLAVFAQSDLSYASTAHHYLATTKAKQAARQGRVTAGGLTWLCRKRECTTEGTKPAPSVKQCRALARIVGELGSCKAVAGPTMNRGSVPNSSLLDPKVIRPGAMAKPQKPQGSAINPGSSLIHTEPNILPRPLGERAGAGAGKDSALLKNRTRLPGRHVPSRRSCPDPAAQRLWISNVHHRCGNHVRRIPNCFDFTLHGEIRNVGAARYESSRSQQQIEIWEKQTRRGWTVVHTQQFGNLMPNNTARIDHPFSRWPPCDDDTCQFSAHPKYALVIRYDPDIRNDGNTKNDECNNGNNRREVSEQQLFDMLVRSVGR